MLKNQSKMIEGGVGILCKKHCRQKIEGKSILVIESGRGKDKRKSENERVEAEGGRTGGKVKCDMK